MLNEIESSPGKDTNPTTPTTPEAKPTVESATTPQDPVVVNTNPPKKSGYKKWIILGIAAVLLLALGMAGGFFLNTQMAKNGAASPTPTISASTDDEQVMCTMDAKECPDGSFVSRQGPNCEFETCPSGSKSSSTETADWKFYSNSDKGFSIKYPDDKFMQYICADEGLVLENRNKANTEMEGKTFESCGRDGRFPIEVQSYPEAPPEMKSDTNYTVTKESVKIGEDSGTLYTLTSNPKCEGICPEKLTEIRLTKNNKTYIFYFEDSTKNILMQMLTTFKIL